MKFTDVHLLVMMDGGRKIKIMPSEIYSIEVSCGSVQVEFLYGGLRTKIEAPIDRVEMLPDLTIGEGANYNGN